MIAAPTSFVSGSSLCFFSFSSPPPPPRPLPPWPKRRRGGPEPAQTRVLADQRGQGGQPRPAARKRPGHEVELACVVGRMARPREVRDVDRVRGDPAAPSARRTMPGSRRRPRGTRGRAPGDCPTRLPPARRRSAPRARARPPPTPAPEVSPLPRAPCRWRAGRRAGTPRARAPPGTWSRAGSAPGREWGQLVASARQDGARPTAMPPGPRRGPPPRSPADIHLVQREHRPAHADGNRDLRGHRVHHGVREDERREPEDSALEKSEREALRGSEVAPVRSQHEPHRGQLARRRPASVSASRAATTASWLAPRQRDAFPVLEMAPSHPRPRPRAGSSTDRSGRSGPRRCRRRLAGALPRPPLRRQRRARSRCRLR